MLHSWYEVLQTKKVVDHSRDGLKYSPNVPYNSSAQSRYPVDEIRFYGDAAHSAAVHIGNSTE
jgi:hypothetical protein